MVNMTILQLQGANMILLSETQDFGSYKLISEAKGKDLFIEGNFAEYGIRNKNGRVYSREVMTEATQKYVSEWVSKGRALGELDHPEGRPTVKSALASHRITKFEIMGEGSEGIVAGKAIILNTPQGQIVRGLLEGGTQLGVSTRALGSIKESNGSRFVQNDFQLFAVDVVTDPSAHSAWVDAINENHSWVVTDDGRILEQFKKAINKSKIDEAAALALFAKFLNEIRVG
jgi:hypothetical protein